MALAEAFDIVQIAFRVGATLLLFVVIGFGPGFILGVLLANRINGKNKPLRVDVHNKAKQRAAEHNKHWNPEDPRWKS